MDCHWAMVGNLPVLYVDATGNAHNPVLTPRLKIADVKDDSCWRRHPRGYSGSSRWRISANRLWRNPLTIIVRHLSGSIQFDEKTMLIKTVTLGDNTSGGVVSVKQHNTNEEGIHEN